MFHRLPIHSIFTGLLLLLFSLQTAAEVASPRNSSLDGIPATPLVYISDYFSFVGQDHQGHVAFALDNNRGRDGETYQAEHFLVLHDEREGWIALQGNGRYDNPRKELNTIPDSPSFTFTGSPRLGITIASDVNRLTLKIEPIPERTRRHHDGGVVWMGSANAWLTWGGRTISGRVIYEYFMMPDFNRLTHTYWGMWNEFQGLYLLSEDSDDVYAHSQKSERIAPLIGKLAGFTTFRNATETVQDLTVEVVDRDFAWGFYHWPKSWRIEWIGPQGKATLTLAQTTRRGIGNWAVGGFSMAIVQGRLEYAGRRTPVYGLAELIM